MFATIGAHCQPANALQFWETHKHEMIQSYQEGDLEGLENVALHTINNILMEIDISCSATDPP